MIRRTFLTTLTAVSAAILSPLKALGVGAKRDRERCWLYRGLRVPMRLPDLTAEIFGKVKLEWWENGNRFLVSDTRTGRVLPIEPDDLSDPAWGMQKQPSAGWVRLLAPVVVPSGIARLRFKVGRESDLPADWAESRRQSYWPRESPRYWWVLDGRILPRAS